MEVVYFLWYIFYSSFFCTRNKGGKIKKKDSLEWAGGWEERILLYGFIVA